MTPAHFIFSSTFLLGLTGLAFHRTYLLSTLLCLESMMLSLYLMLSLWALQLDTLLLAASPLVLLAFSACEAGTGLSLLIATSRTHGTNRIKSLNLLQC